MADKNTTVKFMTEEGEVEFNVLEQTKLNGNTYLLVTCDLPEEDEEALILREVTEEGANEVSYEIVDDDKEMDALARVFEELLEDVELV